MSVKENEGQYQKIEVQDQETGTVVWQMTTFPADHHNIYTTKAAFTPDGATTVFLSRRTGTWNLHRMEVDSGEITQLTDYDQDIGTYTHGLLPDRRAYCIVANQLRTIHIDTLEEKVLFDPRGLMMTYATHQSPDGELIVAKTRKGDLFRIILVATDGSGVRTVFESRNPLGIAVTLITPDKAHIIYHVAERQLWCVDADGRNNRPLYGHESDVWVTHPTCFGNDAAVFAEFPNAIKTVTLDSNVRTIAEFNAWHLCVNRDCSRIVCDTTSPDTGIHIVDVRIGERRLLCHSDSKFPPLESRKGPWVNLWAHPHPGFSPDERMVIFNSCRDGTHTQLFIALVPDWPVGVGKCG